MKRILFILLLTIPFVGFGQDEIKKTYYKNGQIEKEGNYKDGAPDGIWKYYYESGQLERKEEWKDKYEGIDHYRYINYKEYYKNGEIREEGSVMVGGEMDGFLIYQITWDENENKTTHVDNRNNLEYDKW